MESKSSDTLMMVVCEKTYASNKPSIHQIHKNKKRRDRFEVTYPEDNYDGFPTRTHVVGMILVHWNDERNSLVEPRSVAQILKDLTEKYGAWADASKTDLNTCLVWACETIDDESGAGTSGLTVASADDIALAEEANDVTPITTDMTDTEEPHDPILHALHVQEVVERADNYKQHGLPASVVHGAEVTSLTLAAMALNYWRSGMELTADSATDGVLNDYNFKLDGVYPLTKARLILKEIIEKLAAKNKQALSESDKQTPNAQDAAMMAADFKGMQSPSEAEQNYDDSLAVAAAKVSDAEQAAQQATADRDASLHNALSQLG